MTGRPGRRVVRARAPLRLGLAGGGTDLSPYCDEFGGAVLNATIDRYAYAFIEASPDARLHFIARDLAIEESASPDQDGLRAARLAMHAGVYRRMLGQFGDRALPALQVTTYVDAPAGSGLGSSSALVVALVEAFRTWLALPLGLYDVAHLAFEIERIDLALAGGKQDQYASAFGGANFIEFLAGDRVIVNPLRVARGVINELETSLVICFSGVSRHSGHIIREQQRRMAAHGADAIAGLHQLKSDALEMKQALLRGEIRAHGGDPEPLLGGQEAHLGPCDQRPYRRAARDRPGAWGDRGQGVRGRRWRVRDVHCAAAAPGRADPGPERRRRAGQLRASDAGGRGKLGDDRAVASRAARPICYGEPA